MTEKLSLILLSIGMLLLGLDISTSLAQTTKDMVSKKNQELHPESEHSDDPYYCYEHSSEREKIKLSLTEEGDELLGVMQVGSPDSYEGAQNQGFYFFLSGSWTDDRSAEFVMYMFDENEEIIEESKQTATLKVVSDFEIAFINGDGKEITLDQISCEEEE